MNENKRASVPVSDDGIDEGDDIIPDLSEEPWLSRFRNAKVHRGRPRQMTTKVQTTLRLDPEVIERFKADGPGWQSRMNAALRKAAGLP